MTASQVAKETFPSVVLLLMEDENRQPLSLGSGFFISQNIIATNFHVIENASTGYIKLIGDEREYEIEGVVGVDKSRDLALIKVSGITAPSINIKDDDELDIGNKIYVIGNPLGLEGTFSEGIVSGVRKFEDFELYQITAPISPGSSGGPVLDVSGNVVGVAFATISEGKNLNFAILAKYLEPIILSKTSPKPLSEYKRSEEESSLIRDFEGDRTEGVLCRQFRWERYTGGSYSFSIHNTLRHDISNIILLTIFYDDEGFPLDIDVIQYQGIIPGGLSVRFESRIHGSVQEITTDFGKDQPSTPIEFRILHFEFHN